MGKSLMYNEVIWRTTWRKGSWQIADIVKVSEVKYKSRSYIHKEKKKRNSHIQFTCLIKLEEVKLIDIQGI